MSMAWTLYELARNPQVQEKLRAEVEAAFGDTDDLTWEKVDKMHYLENVVKESLRLHSPADITSRVALSDAEIGGHFVPAGTYVLLPMDALQRSLSFWSNPETFDPDRFQQRGKSFTVLLFGYQLVPFDFQLLLLQGRAVFK